MPLYNFKTAGTGELAELFFSMRAAPSIGSTVTVDGQEFVRLPSSPQLKVAQDIHFEASSLPRWDKNADSHDAVGKPRFGSKKAVDEYLAKSEGDWVYD
tara:strand:+ start:298 stop:594 length:297 start_codon:yes stop_codon:yes gene_type:complete